MEKSDLLRAYPDRVSMAEAFAELWKRYIALETNVEAALEMLKWGIVG